MNATEYQALRQQIEDDAKRGIEQVREAARVRLRALEVVYGFAAREEAPAEPLQVREAAQHYAPSDHQRPGFRQRKARKTKAKDSVRVQVREAVRQWPEGHQFTIQDVRDLLGGRFSNAQLRNALARLDKSLVKIAVAGAPPRTPATYVRTTMSDDPDAPRFFGEPYLEVQAM